jgi:hypothetical protein
MGSAEGAGAPSGRALSLVRQAAARALAALEWLLGLVTILAVLSLLTAFPLLSFVALGYILEAQGRLARTGRLLDAFHLVDLAPRLGGIVIGVWLSLFPLRILAGMAEDARIIHPGSPADAGLHGLLKVLGLAVTVHLCLALAAGGRLARFVTPFANLRSLREETRRGGYWSRAEANLREFVSALSVRHHFWLGLRGWVGSFLWLVPPSFLFAAADKPEGAPIVVTLVGGVFLGFVFSWLPFLQARFAVEGRFPAFFELSAIRSMFGRAPVSWLLSVFLTLALALPLYLFKIAIPPEDALFLITPVFVLAVVPAKILTGWAYHRALTRPQPAFFLFRWGARLALVPVLAVYVFLLFFTQFIGQHGKGVLFEHHAFLLRVGFE